MTMKQTQTKLFDFSDVGLDFCAGSKNLFPDCFKKMLSLGYNEQTVSSVAVTGSQVVLTYGVSHGYVADRILKITSGALAAINGGEFWIDSVTTNTVTLTIEGALISVAGGFVTKIASLGWQLVYEQAHIHIYKFKHIDDTDMYARLCFQNATAVGNRNCIAIGIGRTVNLISGAITDPNCLAGVANCETVAGVVDKWDFTSSTAATFNNYSYNQGVATFGRSVVTGSVYHFALCFSIINSTVGASIAGIFPFSSDYSAINYPALFLAESGASTSATSASNGYIPTARIYVGKERCSAMQPYGSGTNSIGHSISENSFLPSSVDEFNTTMAYPMQLQTHLEKQPIGFVGGIYQACFSNNQQPSTGVSVSPSLTKDMDLNSNVVLHNATLNTTASRAWFAIPVEEVKIV